jgi:hypothetical protein
MQGLLCPVGICPYRLDDLAELIHHVKEDHGHDDLVHPAICSVGSCREKFMHMTKLMDHLIWHNQEPTPIIIPAGPIDPSIVAKNAPTHHHHHLHAGRNDHRFSRYGQSTAATAADMSISQLYNSSNNLLGDGTTSLSRSSGVVVVGGGGSNGFKNNDTSQTINGRNLHPLSSPAAAVSETMSTHKLKGSSTPVMTIGAIGSTGSVRSRGVYNNVSYASSSKRSYDGDNVAISTTTIDNTHNGALSLVSGVRSDNDHDADVDGDNDHDDGAADDGSDNGTAANGGSSGNVRTVRAVPTNMMQIPNRTAGSDSDARGATTITHRLHDQTGGNDREIADQSDHAAVHTHKRARTTTISSPAAAGTNTNNILPNRNISINIVNNSNTTNNSNNHNNNVSNDHHHNNNQSDSGSNTRSQNNGSSSSSGGGGGGSGAIVVSGTGISTGVDGAGRSSRSFCLTG